MSCDRPGPPGQLAAQHVRLALQHPGLSGKGHEYFLKHLLGTSNGVQGKDLGKDEAKPKKCSLARQGARRQAGPAGHAGLPHEHHLPVFSDIVLPTATWYEKNDLNTSDMHPFIHPLSTAVDPAWQSRSDWEIYKGFAKKFSEVCVGHLGVERETGAHPI
jgi:nitrate reductase alpha subunit